MSSHNLPWQHLDKDPISENLSANQNFQMLQEETDFREAVTKIQQVGENVENHVLFAHLHYPLKK